MKNKSMYFIGLLILVSLTPQLNADLTITAFDAGRGKLTIGYLATGGAVPVAFGLGIHLSDGATVGSSDVLSVDLHFPVYLDYVYSNPGDYHLGDGHPLASHDGAGEQILPASDVSLCLSAFESYPAPGAFQDLNGDDQVDHLDVAIFSEHWLEVGFGFPVDFNMDNQIDLADFSILAGPDIVTPDAVLNLITLQLNDGGAGYTDVIIELDALRGGITGKDLGMVTTPGPLRVVIPEPSTLSLLALGAMLAGRTRK